MPPEQQGQLCSAPFTSHISWTAALPFSSGSSPAAAASGVTTSAAGRSCPADPGQPLGLFCAPYGNPNSGITSFDNILWAWLTIFQLITQEGWTDVLYWSQDAVSDWVWIYYVLLLGFGSFFAVNLAIAVLYVQFVKEGRPPAPKKGAGALALALGPLSPRPSDTQGLPAAPSGALPPLSAAPSRGLPPLSAAPSSAQSLWEQEQLRLGSGKQGPQLGKAAELGAGPGLSAADRDQPPAVRVAAFAEEDEQPGSSAECFDDALLQVHGGKGRSPSGKQGPRPGSSASRSSQRSQHQRWGDGWWGALRRTCYSVQAHRWALAPSAGSAHLTLREQLAASRMATAATCALLQRPG